MAADLMVKNAWYVAGLAHEFPAQQLQGQVIAEKRPVMWRTTAGSAVAFDERCRHKRMPLSQGRLVEAACSNAPITACATTGRANASEYRRIRTVTFLGRLGCIPSRSSNRTSSSGSGRETPLRG